MRPPSGELNSLGSVAYLDLKKKKRRSTNMLWFPGPRSPRHWFSLLPTYFWSNITADRSDSAQFETVFLPKQCTLSPFLERKKLCWSLFPPSSSCWLSGWRWCLVHRMIIFTNDFPFCSSLCFHCVEQMNGFFHGLRIKHFYFTLKVLLWLKAGSSGITSSETTLG